MDLPALQQLPTAMSSSTQWNLPLDTLPEACDVLVIGCGPAGSACARTLALAGIDVVMVDSKVFPRDKTCGDGLVPDAHAALHRLGMLDEVMAKAKRLPFTQCIAPNQQSIDVPGELAVLPRRDLDALLCQGALRAGARMFAPVKFEAVIEDAQGRVTGARLRMGPAQRELRAQWLVLATGANVQGLQAANMCLRKSPSGMAVRAYIKHPGLAEHVTGMRFTWHKTLKGGYGWVFPGPDDTFNLGVGVFSDSVGKRMSKINLRDMFQAFLAADPVAAQLAQHGQWQGELSGAPLRCDLDGARWHRPGILLAGDAIGSTYAFTGEGIGKALETGMASAEALLAHASQWQTSTNASGDAAVMTEHHNKLQAIAPKFLLFRKASSFNRYPWLLNPVVWRAKRSVRLQNALADILAERRQPGSLLSWRGVKALLWG